MPTKPEVEEVTDEQVDKLVRGLLPLLNKEDGWEKVKELTFALEKKAKSLEGMEGIDGKTMLTRFDELKASVETLTKQIKTNPKFTPPGMENERFNTIRFMIGCHLGNHEHPDAHSESELEQVKAIYAHVEKKYGAKAAQSIGDPAKGAAWIPDQALAENIGALYHQLVFVKWGENGAQRLRVFDNLFGAKVTMLKANGGIVVYTASEEKDALESLAQTGELVFNPKKLHAMIRLTESMRDFAPAQFNDYLTTEAFNKFGEKLDYVCGYGKGGDNEPLGIFKNPAISLFSAQSKGLVANNATAITAANSGDWQGAELTYDVMELVKTALKRKKVTLDASAAWISAPEVFTRLKLAKYITHGGQTTEKPFLWGMMLNDEKLRTLIGDFGESAQFAVDQKPGATVGAPSATGAAKFTDAAFAKWNQGFLGRWFGFKIEDDGGKGKYFPSGGLLKRISMTYDVQIGREEAFMLVPDAKAQD